MYNNGTACKECPPCWNGYYNQWCGGTSAGSCVMCNNNWRSYLKNAWRGWAKYKRRVWSLSPPTYNCPTGLWQCACSAVLTLILLQTPGSKVSRLPALTTSIILFAELCSDAAVDVFYQKFSGVLACFYRQRSYFDRHVIGVQPQRLASTET